MKTIEDKNFHFELTNGRKFYAFGNILGMGPDMELTYGFDGHVSEREEPFSKAERIEISFYMQELWSKWAEGSEPSDSHTKNRGGVGK